MQYSHQMSSNLCNSYSSSKAYIIKLGFCCILRFSTVIYMQKFLLPAVLKWKADFCDVGRLQSSGWEVQRVGWKAVVKAASWIARPAASSLQKPHTCCHHCCTISCWWACGHPHNCLSECLWNRSWMVRTKSLTVLMFVDNVHLEI